MVSATRVTVNDTVYATALVNGAGGTPTGRVYFNLGSLPLGVVRVEPRGTQGQAADIAFPAYLLGGTGTATLTAQYSGDTAFNPAGATRSLTVTAPPTTAAAAIVVSYPGVVWPTFPDAEGEGWQTRITLRDVGFVPSIVAGFRIDGEAQPIAKYFSSPNIQAGGSVLVNLIFRKVAGPVTRTFEFTGYDANGSTWSRTVSVMYMPTPSSVGFNVSATPMTVNKTSDPSCEWPVQVSVDEIDGRGTTLAYLWIGTMYRPDISAVFGTDRLPAWGSLQSTVCFNGINPPATGSLQVNGANGFVQQILVSFMDAPSTPSKLTATPATVTLASPGKAEATIDLSTVDKAQQWSVAVFPMSRMAGWLKVTPQSGTGPGKITLSANSAGYGPGAYRALIVIQSPTGSPQTMTVPVMFVLGAAPSGMSITSAANAASGAPMGAPGMLMSIYGTGLAKEVGAPVTAAVNGIAAQVLYSSPTQVNIRIPYEVGSGPAVVGIQNESGVAGAQIQIAPSSPGIFAEAMVREVQVGTLATLFMTGAGELQTVPLSFTASPIGPRPLLPLSVTVGGVPAFVQLAGDALQLPAGERVDFIPAANTPGGEQPLVVTVAGVASKPVTVVVKK